MFRIRHRHAIALPFLVLALVALVGGPLNSIDAHGRIVDDLTDEGVKDAGVQHGVRSTTTNANGEYTITAVPRTGILQIDALGYLRQKVSTTAEEVRVKPLSLTIYAYDGSKTPNDRLKNPQARDPQTPTKILATGNESGQMIITPHPGKDAQIMVCAEGFQPQTIKAHGVLMQVGLQPGGEGCPPIPTPSPAPVPSGASPAPSGASPAPSPSAPAPSPTATP